MKKLPENSMPAIFLNKLNENPDAVLFKYFINDAWAELTRKEFWLKIVKTANFLLKNNIKKDSKCGIFSVNRVEWAFADYGILSTGAADVTIYPTSSADEAKYIINHGDVEICFCGDQKQLDVLRSIRAETPKLRKIIIFDDLDCEQANGEYCFSDILADSTLDDEDLIIQNIEKIDPNSMMTMMYTSGTTAEPKGVMLSHSNMVSQVLGFHEKQPRDSSKVETCFSLLPLSHALERTVIYDLTVSIGGVMAFSRGPKYLLEDLQAIRPTSLLFVPRVLEKIYETITAKVGTASLSKQVLFKRAINSAQKALPYFLANQKIPFFTKISFAFYRKVLFSKIRATLGLDRAHCLGIGGAPVQPEVNLFFHAMGVPVLAGYGLTETSPVLHTATWYNIEPLKLETVGKAMPGTKTKIAEDGEILAKGPQIMMGYYKNPEATKEAFTEDGWFKTGDIGVIDKAGYLTVTDRKKELIITSGGKNISPAQVEGNFMKFPTIQQFVLVGDQRKFLVGLLVPEEENILNWAKSNNINEDYPALLENPLMIDYFKNVMKEVNQKLSRVEQVKKIYVLANPFTLERKEITPTLKFKRRIILTNYAAEIDELYLSNEDILIKNN